MLDDLDSTLKKFLIYELPDLQNSSETSVSINFDLPVEGGIQQKPAINLFLYDVRENVELRSREWKIQRRDNGTAVKTQPPARIDCSYLITVWVNADDPQQEHHILSKIMRLLLSHTVIPPEMLQGSLCNQELPVMLTSMQSGYLQSPSEFWQVMGGRAKVSLHCTVTIAVPIEKDTGEFPIVLENLPQMSRLSSSHPSQ